tara:strand:+ start:207 stop:773 length:567 start_codon:yes stop_codon:yes gene_type:complete
MKISIEQTSINDVKVIVPEVFRDDRGFFSEVYRSDQFNDLGLPTNFVQDNQSGSGSGVIRGLHFQWEPPMGKLIGVTVGKVFLVAVDIRKNSPTLGNWVGLEVSAENRKMLWAPAGFARGMCPLADYSEIQYKCTGLYNKNCESNILWNDPDIGIKWPIKNPLISERDKNAKTFKEWLQTPESDNFRY